MKRIFLMIAVLIGCTVFVACDGDDDNNALDGKYITYTRALQKRYPKATDIEWEIKGIYHVADFNLGRDDMEAWYNGDVQWRMSRTDMDANLLGVDAVVAQAFSTGDYGDWDIDEISFYERFDNDNFYLFEVDRHDMPDMLLFYATDGTLLKAIPDTAGFSVTPDTEITPNF